MLMKGTTIAHAYALVSAGGTAMSISIVAEGRNNRARHDTLVEAIKNSLRIY
jgi:hypothetical protein